MRKVGSTASRYAKHLILVACMLHILGEDGDINPHATTGSQLCQYLVRALFFLFFYVLRRSRPYIYIYIYASG